jgi:predicted transcriptional regulator
VTGRDVVEVTLAMTMDWVTYMWHSEGDLGGVQRAERQSEIIAFIEASGAATLMQIAKELDVNKGSLYKELNDLVFQRVLTRNDGGKGRVTYSLMGQ